MKNLKHIFSISVMLILFADVSMAQIDAEGGTNTFRRGSFTSPYHFVSPSVFGKSGKSAPNDHAIIISGGDTPLYNYNQYWNDCSLVYQYYTDVVGIPASNITVLMADGKSTDQETLFRSEKDSVSPTSYSPEVKITESGGYRFYIVDAPKDLNGDGTDDIDKPATWADLRNTFDSLANIKDINTLWIFVTDHGSRSQNQICLWKPLTTQNVNPRQFKNFLDGLTFKYTNIFFAQCYSGGFLSELKGDNRTIVTATSASKSSWSLNGEFSHFFRKFFDALVGVSFEGETLDSYIDANGDKNVSMEEAFIYAKDNDGWSKVEDRLARPDSFEAPQFYSSESDFIYCRYDLNGMEEIKYDRRSDIVLEAMYDLIGRSSLENCDVVFRSGKYIHLRDGFRTKNANFRTEFISCEDQYDYLGDINSREQYATELNEQLDDEVRNLTLYPNPTEGVLTILLGEDAGEKVVSIVNIGGGFVYEGRTSDKKIQIDISDQPTGIYLVRVTSDNNAYAKYIVKK